MHCLEAKVQSKSGVGSAMNLECRMFMTHLQRVMFDDSRDSATPRQDSRRRTNRRGVEVEKMFLVCDYVGCYGRSPGGARLFPIGANKAGVVETSREGGRDPPRPGFGYT